ncbi:MAG: BON domain-containing protein [Acidobacteria bacterium]|nr:BON domain-containing protein [Acidobacteriota bacterium]
MRRLVPYFAVLAFVLSVACTTQRSYKDDVSRALEQADLKEVDVTEDAGTNVITLGGKVHSEEAKARAAEVAQGAAGPRIVANEISVEPVGLESEARDIQENRDNAIRDNYRAALMSKGLDKEDIDFEANNGVLTLKGNVKSPKQREEAQELATNIPNVEQVINEIQVEGSESARR